MASCCGWVCSTTDRSLAVTCWIRYGFIAMPPLATVSANMASCSGVSVVSCCPIASKAVNDLSDSAVKLDGAAVTPEMACALGVVQAVLAWPST